MAENSRIAHALPVIMSVGMLIAAVCLLAVGALSPNSGVRPFLFTFGGAMGVAATYRLVRVAQYEKDIERLHRRLAKVDPDSCPDYWQSGFSKCHGTSCRPRFHGQNLQGEQGTVWMMKDATEDTEIRLRDYKSMAPDSLCNLNRQYPWMELTNECAARNSEV